MSFIPNIHFTILVKAEGRLREFNFRKRAEDNYDADTSDERGNRHLFKWIRRDSEWEIIPLSPTIPAWIVSNKTNILAKFDQYTVENNIGL